jgi:hypothetical protein
MVGVTLSSVLSAGAAFNSYMDAQADLYEAKAEYAEAMAWCSRNPVSDESPGGYTCPSRDDGWGLGVPDLGDPDLGDPDLGVMG